jgi:peptide deformylase
MSTVETGLRIRFYGDPSLRKHALPVAAVTDKDRAVFQEMAEAMRLAGGVGLAAPQVGINRQFLIIDIGEGLTVLVNPRITKKSGSQAMEEGCLSLPGVYVKVKRARSIKVDAMNEFNEKVSFSVKDLMARAVQHEIDHLRGRVIIDYASFFEKIRLRKKLKYFLNRKNA